MTTADETLPLPISADAHKELHASLKKDLVRGVMWTGGVKWLAQLISWPIMIVIARVLSPADFGFVALVTVWTRLIMLLTEGGVGGAIVLGQPLNRRQLSQLNAIAMSLSIAAFLVAVALSVPVARFYKSPDLTWVMIGIASTFLLEGAMLIPTARLRREMRFRELAIADAARAVVDSLVTLTLAMLGARYWSLVAGYSAGVLTVAAVTIRLRPTPFHLPHWADVGATLKHARELLLASISGFLYSSSDLVIAGRILSAGAVGAYTFANTIAYAPGDKLVSVLTRVTPSVFGTIGADAASMRIYVERLTRVLALAIFPVFGGIAATAPTLVPVLLGPQWAATVVPLQLICIHAAVMSVTQIVPQVLQSTGSARVVSENGFLALLAYPPAFYLLGSNYGIVGIAAAWALLTPLLRARLIGKLSDSIGLSSRAYIRLLLPAIIGTIWMLLLVRVATRLSGPYVTSGIVQLIVQILSGVLSYALAALVLDRSTLTDLGGRAMRIMRRRATS